MPREGVPYPERLLCSLRCELKNIWNALNGKLHSVNGVEGNGQGNVNIVSGDAAVVVTTDPSLNQIEVSLDQSQLPAAAVTSVNGQTGTVVLDGTDIKTAVYGPNNNAIQDIGAARTAIQTVSQSVTAEATARQNADSALQTNINTVTASLPGAAAAAVAADPTVALIPGKLDKRTESGVNAYTHDGSTQGDIRVIDGTNASTIPIRDANGRMQAADPASGATDKTLVTTNWISQTGDSSPNNVLHKTGTETITSGQKHFSVPNYGYCLALIDNGLDITNIQSQRVHTLPFIDRNGVGVANIRYVVQTNGSILIQLEMRKTDGTFKYINLGDNS